MKKIGKSLYKVTGLVTYMRIFLGLIAEVRGNDFRDTIVVCRLVVKSTITNKRVIAEDCLHAMRTVPPYTETAADSSAKYVSELDKLPAEMDKNKPSHEALSEFFDLPDGRSFLNGPFKAFQDGVFSKLLLRNDIRMPFLRRLSMCISVSMKSWQRKISQW